jgi:nitronate monooxygenase
MQLKVLASQLRLPVICAPMFLISDPKLTIAACKAGVVGSFNSQNARTPAELTSWLTSIESELAAARAASPLSEVAPYAMNMAARKVGNERYGPDLETCVRFRVPLVITMVGNPREIVDAVHSYGGQVIHDVATVEHAYKALDAGVDGLIVLCAGAGGHTGTLNPFAFLPQLRKFFSGLVALAGGICDGRGVWAAQALGADMAYIGTRFIATVESGAPARYKDMLVSHGSKDVVLTDAVSGLPANFLRGSIESAGLDPNALPPPSGLFRPNLPERIKAWRDVWGAGQGVGLIEDIPTVDELVSRLRLEYEAARLATAQS